MDNINFSDIFIKTHQEYYTKYKKKNGTLKKHDIQSRYHELLKFVSNSTYWTRHNKDPETHLYNKNCITGKNSF